MNIELFKKTSLDSKPASYSCSSLKTYSNCSQAYKYRYIDKIRPQTASISTIIGSLLHDSLEIFLHSDNELVFIRVFEEQSKATFIERKYIKPESLPKLDTIYPKLVELAKDIRTLYYRASEDYKGANPIRTKAGEVPKNPQMTTGWKDADKNLNLYERRRELVEDFSSLALIEVNLVEAFMEAYNLACLYETPEEIIETLALEFPISSYDYETKELINPVFMPPEFGGEEGIYLNGYIDWIGYVNFKGRRCLALIDYKSSQEEVLADRLEYHAQLLSYVYAVETLLGIPVEVIGIHNLRHKKLALAEVDRDILKVVNISLFSKHKKIKDGHFYQEDVPDSMYSKCLKSFGRECEYLHICYPKMFNKLHPDSLDAQIAALIDI